VTDDSAFKRQVRARMAETGEKYTVARRMVTAERDPAQPAVLRVYLNPHVDLELTTEAGQAYATADEQGRREIAARLLADQIEAAGLEGARVAASSKIVTGQEPRIEVGAVQDAVIRGVVQRGAERAAGLSSVNVDDAAYPVLRVTVRAARPILLVGARGAEADRLRTEMEELTGRRVRLEILEVPDSQEMPGAADPGARMRSTWAEH
jgi:hypothetical protein